MVLTVPAGAQLGRYEIVKHLASGLMAELLLARARGLEGFERHFVIKRIRAEQERDEAFIEMFLAEARLAASLHHHNIVQVHDIGEDDGKPYFAMEYVHGEDLRRVLGRLFERGEHIPLEHVIAIVCSVAGALHHAHEALGPDRVSLGIVHRDVTPANILLGYDGNVKVVDFGIARAAMRRTETQAGMLVGKAPYMAPEQCVGGTIDRRSDVFALGIVLFELITGRRLFKGDNEFLTMSAVVEANVPPPSAHRSDVSPALDKIVLKALSRDPAQRYQTAEQMFFALDTLASAEGLRSSGLGLAAFMKELFGHRVEPWLGDDDRPRSTSPDFDGAYPGLAAPPTGALDNFVEPASKKASPITRARNHAISDQFVTVRATTVAAAAVPQSIGEQRSNAVRIPEGPVVAQGRPRDKNAFRTTQVPVAPMPTRPRPKTKTVQIPITPRTDVVELVESTKVDADLLEIPVEPAPPRAAPTIAKVDSTAPPRKDATPPPKVVSIDPPKPSATKGPAIAVPSTTAAVKPAASSSGARPADATASDTKATSASSPRPSSGLSVTAFAQRTSSAAPGASKIPSVTGASKTSSGSDASSGSNAASVSSASSGSNAPSVSSGSNALPVSSASVSNAASGSNAASNAPSVTSASSGSNAPSVASASVASASVSNTASTLNTSSGSSSPSSVGLAASSTAATAVSSTPSGSGAPRKNTPPPMPAMTAGASAGSSTSSGARKNTPPPLPVVTARNTPPPMQALAPTPVLATSSQSMAPVVESSSSMVPVVESSSQSMAPVVESRSTPSLAEKSSSRHLPLPIEPEPETEIDPLSSRQGEVAPKSPSIWNNPEMFEPDEPSVVVRSKSLVFAALAAEAARTDAEDARADAEDARAAAERERADSQIEPPTRVDDLRMRAASESFAEQTEIDDGPTRVPGDGRRVPGDTNGVPVLVSIDEVSTRVGDERDSIDSIDDGPTSVMPDYGNEVPPPPSAMPAGWVPPGAPLPRARTPRATGGPAERGSQDRITPLPPPPMMPEITDYPRLRTDQHDHRPAPKATATPVQGWMPAAPTVDSPPMSSRRKKLIAGGIGAVVLVAIIAFAMRGGDDEKPATGSGDVATPKMPQPTESRPEVPTPTEKQPIEPTPTETGIGTPVPSPPDKTTLRPPKKPVKAPPKVAAKPPVKPPAKKPPVKKPPVTKPPVKKPPPKPGWDPNSLFPKKK